MVANIEEAVNGKYDKLNAQNKKNMNTLKNKVRKYIAGSTLEEELKKLKSAKVGTTPKEEPAEIAQDEDDENEEKVEEVKTKKTKA